MKKRILLNILLLLIFIFTSKANIFYTILTIIITYFGIDTIINYLMYYYTKLPKKEEKKEEKQAIQTNQEQLIELMQLLNQGISEEQKQNIINDTPVDIIKALNEVQNVQ